MVNYKNGKIYKIINDVTDEIYVGSTTKNTLAQRFGDHKSKLKLTPNRAIYSKMNELGLEHFKIVLIELHPCETKDELNSREQYWIDELKPSLNTYSAKGSKWEQDSEFFKQYKKEYRQTNKDRIAEYNRKHYKEHREDILERNRKRNTERHCDVCNINIGANHFKRHEKSVSHQNKLVKEASNEVEIIFSDSEEENDC